MEEALLPTEPATALVAHPHASALSDLALKAATDAAQNHRFDFATPGANARSPALEGATLRVEDAQTEFGNLLAVLERGAETGNERQLLGALLAIGVARTMSDDDSAVDTLAGQLVWLATHTPCNALSSIDAALADRAGVLWEAIGRIAGKGSESVNASPPASLVAAAALVHSKSDTAYRIRLHLAQTADDPVLRALLGRSGRTSELRGELGTAPLSPLATALLAFTLVLFLIRGLRLLARVALNYKKPALLRIGPEGLELSHRTELMGKVIRDRSTLVPLANLSRVTREVRYARIGLYAGLTALVLGTYFGVGLIVDGVRVPGGSPPLLGMAVFCILLGLAFDFLLSTASDSARGRCRVVIVPHKGRPLCVGALDPTSADAMLTSIAEHAHG
jgi:hypothetical protein